MRPELDPTREADEPAAEQAAERRWQDAFARSTDLLNELAEEARAEHRAGATEPLDPESL